MNDESRGCEVMEETRAMRLVRAATWTGILSAAALFWAMAGWLLLG